MREEELKDNAMVNVIKIILRHNEEMLKVFMLFVCLPIYYDISSLSLFSSMKSNMFMTQVSLAIVVGATGVFLVLLVAVMTLAFWR